MTRKQTITKIVTFALVAILAIAGEGARVSTRENNETAVEAIAGN